MANKSASHTNGTPTVLVVLTVRFDERATRSIYESNHFIHRAHITYSHASMSFTCAVASSHAVGIRPSRVRVNASSSRSTMKMATTTTTTRGSSLRVAATGAEVMDKLDDDGRASWESCKMMVMDLGLDEEAADKCLVKAFGWCVRACKSVVSPPQAPRALSHELCALFSHTPLVS